MSRIAGIYASQDELASRLRDACPDWTFAEEGEARQHSRIAIIHGSESAGSESTGSTSTGSKSVARIVLDSTAERRPGELHLSRAEFLRSPGHFLAFASDLADAAVHAAQLEQEVNYLRQIHELMTMVDAEAVSERITTTVLELLGFAHGTLFLHDPRYERYMVSFSNDPDYHETGEFLPGIPAAGLQEALASPALFAVASDMIIMPLQVHEDLLGVIKVPLGPGEAVDEAHAGTVTRYLAAVAQVLGNIYQLTRSRDLAMRDDLTKAYNRRFFETYLDEEIERSRRYGALFTIIFLDLDDLDGEQFLRPPQRIAHPAGSCQAHPRRRTRHRQGGPLRRRRVLRDPSPDRSGAGRRRRQPHLPLHRLHPSAHRLSDRSNHHRLLRHRHLPPPRDEQGRPHPPGRRRHVPREVDHQERGGSGHGGGCHAAGWRLTVGGSG
jgi:hypothetical protein